MHLPSVFTRPVPDKVFKAASFSVLVAMIACLSFQFNDSDLYYIIATGREILANGIPYTNPFITTPDLGIVVQNWLYCAACAWISEHLHTLGLWLFQSVQLVFMAAMLNVFLNFRTRNSFTEKCFAIVVLFLTFGYTNLRPEMITFCLIAIELCCIERFAKTGKSLQLWLIPLTALLEANLHASYWIMHYVVLLPYIVPVPKALRFRKENLSARQILTVSYPAALGLALLFINPYGKAGITYVFDALRGGAVGLFGIAEQAAFSIMSVHNLILILSVLLAIHLWKKGALGSCAFLMYAGFSVLLVYSIKFTPFWTIGLMYIVRALIEAYKDRNVFEKPVLYQPVMLFFIAALAIAGGVYVNGAGECFDAKTDDYMTKANFMGWQDFASFDKYLSLNDPDAAVFAVFADANYFEYKGYKVYFDARPEIYANPIAGSDEVAQTALKVLSRYDKLGAFRDKKAGIVKKDMEYRLSQDEFNAVIDSLNVEYFVLDPAQYPSLTAYMESRPDKYEVILEGESYRLYGRIWYY